MNATDWLSVANGVNGDKEEGSIESSCLYFAASGSLSGANDAVGMTPKTRCAIFHFRYPSRSDLYVSCLTI
jgi:hypothetical protein